MRNAHNLMRLGRDLRSVSQSQLSELTGIGTATLCRVERGERKLITSEVEAIASALDIPTSFFESSCSYLGAVGDVQFRKKSASTAKNRRWAVANANLASYLVQSATDLIGDIEGSIPLEPVSIAETGHNPEWAANWLKANWRIPPGPVKNLMALTEEAGVYVFCLDLGAFVDGLSLWLPDQNPVVFLNANTSGDRQRWTLAHELGHLLMHTKGVLGEDVELEANQFAAELLMPREEVRRQLRYLRLENLKALKAEWEVSMQALIMRAVSLGVATKFQATKLFKMFSSKGWRKREPVRIPIERNSLVPKLTRDFETALGSREKAAEHLGFQMSDYNFLAPRRRIQFEEGLRLLRPDEG